MITKEKGKSFFFFLIREPLCEGPLSFDMSNVWVCVASKKKFSLCHNIYVYGKSIF